MGKKLAIKGHSTRGKEVIELFEMMGGENICEYEGHAVGYNYYICNSTIIYEKFVNDDDFVVFTLEEFLENYPFKVGDKVFLYDNITEGCVTGMKWDKEKETVKYCVYTSAEYWCDVKELLKWNTKWNNVDLFKRTYMDNMGKKLAIKGHETRGEEVIKILEMLGGKMPRHQKLAGNASLTWYYINSDSYIEYQSRSIFVDDAIFFTLEEFLEKFPYKVGDKVQHKGATYCGTVYVIEQIKWEDNQVKYIICNLFWKNCKSTVTVEDLQPFKAETMEENIKEKDKNLEDLQPYKDEAVLNKWSGLKVELELSKSVIGVSNVESIRGEKFMSGFVKAIIPPEGYQFLDEKGNVINTTKIVLEKKKNEYPKTYEECYDEYNTDLHFIYVDKDERDLYESFIKLIRCRDSYWKIAGGQIGVDKSWKPDWEENDGGYRYCIRNQSNKIILSNEWLGENYILSFPTAEMRDAFYENFKDLIEKCKELL